jgi:hypothetical protein
MLKLSSTSALVLLWAQQDCYQSKRALDYLSRLDLEEGKALFNKCHEAWPHYAEIIKNRKFGVLSLIDKACSKKIAEQQLIIAGAGLDPLGIEVTERYPHVKIFELDKENMGLKSHLFTNAENTSKVNITFIDIDLMDVHSLYDTLIANGWDTGNPTILVLEGISYYLHVKTLQGLARVIDPDYMIFEYLKKDGQIAADRIDIPGTVFNIISHECELPHIGRFDYSEVARLFNRPVIARYGMTQLEKMRTGSNRFFQTEASGWIEVCLLKKSCQCRTKPIP